jgi:hypothetical protein
METLYNKYFLVHDYEYGEECIVASYSSYREAELYIINNSQAEEGRPGSMEIEEIKCPIYEETDRSKLLVLKMGWYLDAKDGEVVGFPSKFWAIVSKDATSSPTVRRGEGWSRYYSFIGPHHCNELFEGEKRVNSLIL